MKFGFSIQFPILSRRSIGPIPPFQFCKPPIVPGPGFGFPEAVVQCSPLAVRCVVANVPPIWTVECKISRLEDQADGSGHTLTIV